MYTKSRRKFLGISSEFFTEFRPSFSTEFSIRGISRHGIPRNTEFRRKTRTELREKFRRHKIPPEFSRNLLGIFHGIPSECFHGIPYPRNFETRNSAKHRIPWKNSDGIPRKFRRDFVSPEIFTEFRGILFRQKIPRNFSDGMFMEFRMRNSVKI